MEDQFEPAPRRLSQDELEALADRERARMSEPDYRSTLVRPPDFLAHPGWERKD